MVSSACTNMAKVGFSWSGGLLLCCFAWLFYLFFLFFSQLGHVRCVLCLVCLPLRVRPRVCPVPVLRGRRVMGGVKAATITSGMARRPRRVHPQIIAPILFAARPATATVDLPPSPRPPLRGPSRLPLPVRPAWTAVAVFPCFHIQPR